MVEHSRSVEPLRRCGLRHVACSIAVAVGVGLSPAPQAVAGPTGPAIQVAPAPVPDAQEDGTSRPGADETRLPAAASGGPARPRRDLSPVGMVRGADPVVQGVMLLLALASVTTWTVLLVRALALCRAKRRIRAAIRAIRAAASLSAAAASVPGGAAGALIAAAEGELARSPGLPAAGIRARAEATLGRVEAAEARWAAAQTGILATIGSTGPFVGLFGTVWGIMHSFIGIAESHTTNLAVVAPGIAEALLATGIGLVAAIPAVVIYNALIRAAATYRALLADAAILVLGHLSRDLDIRASGARGPQPAGLRVAAE